MPLHKKTITGDVTQTLSYTVPTADAYGAQVLDVRFYDGSGELAAADGAYSIEWSPNGRDWTKFVSVTSDSPVGNWQVGGYVHSIRAVPSSVTGSATWSVDFRFHGIGYPGANTSSASSGLSEEDEAFNRGDSFRVDYPFTIAQGGDPIVIKYTVTDDTILTLSTIELDQGGIEYKVFTESQATETSSFDNAIAVYPKNLTVTPSASPVSVLSGGSVTFTGQQNTTLRVRTASGAGNRDSAVSGESTKRGFGDSIVYAEIARLEGVNVDTTGVLKQEFYRK